MLKICYHSLRLRQKFVTTCLEYAKISCAAVDPAVLMFLTTVGIFGVSAVATAPAVDVPFALAWCFQHFSCPCCYWHPCSCWCPCCYSCSRRSCCCFRLCSYCNKSDYRTATIELIILSVIGLPIIEPLI
jgi:hypothetical protein